MRKFKQAMILAAGLGTRMKELTNEIPKPMIMVEDIALIERIINYIYKLGIEKIVINTHYKAEILEEFVSNIDAAKKIEIIFSRENKLLGTAGGVKNVLKHFNNEPFFVLNSDSLFVDSEANETSLDQLENSWNPDLMNMSILLVPLARAYGYRYNGDFDLNEDGTLCQKSDEKRDYVHPGLYLMDYRLFNEFNERELLQFYPEVMLNLIRDKKLFGVVYKGKWFHIGDKQAHQQFQGF